MEKSGGQLANNAFRDIALVPTGRQHPTPKLKPPALIPTLKKNARQSQETKLPRNNVCYAGATKHINKTINCKTVRIFAYARAVKQKVWNEAENRERDWGETLKIRLTRVGTCEALAVCARETLNFVRFTDSFTDFEEKTDCFAV